MQKIKNINSEENLFIIIYKRIKNILPKESSIRLYKRTIKYHNEYLYMEMYKYLKKKYSKNEIISMFLHMIYNYSEISIILDNDDSIK